MDSAPFEVSSARKPNAKRTDASRCRRIATAIATAAWSLTIGLAPPFARAQEAISGFRKPVLVVETDGHHAPVRALVWGDDNSLLSAGLDKVVKHWDVGGEPRLADTIRPPIWRGPAGIVYSIALSPWKTPKGTRLLAVAGYGVDSSRGDFTIYPYPASTPGEPTDGRPLARLMPPADPKALGQRDTVLTLAFHPKLQSLATAGAKGIVTLWDTSTFRPFAALSGHGKPIRALGYLPNGKQLVTIGEDKTLRLWDLDRNVEIDRFQASSILNSLAINAAGSSIVAGTESGGLFEFNPLDVRTPRAVLPTLAEQGSIEALAFSPDGRRLVSSVMASKADMVVASDRIVACDIEVRDLPAGNVVDRRRLTGLAYSLSFRPDGKAFAYSGGPDQAIRIQSLDNLQAAPSVLRGKGSTVYEVGFSEDSRVAGFARTPGPTLAETVVDAFDMAARKSVRVPFGGLRRSINEYDGWSVDGSIKGYRLALVKAGRAPAALDIDRGLERLWWSYTFIPPGPGHPKPVLAVGTESGIVVYDLETAKRTRVFAGHSSPVVSLATSPDGRWLASGSVDQTLILYPLDGIDVRPSFGLTLATVKTGQVAVAGVENRGFAASLGLLPGDILTQTMIARGSTRTNKTDPQGLLDFVKAADELEPQTAQIAVWVRRTQLFGPLLGFTYDLPPLPSTKRNNPAFSLMLDNEREWVLWTPQGYYDTSIEGDTRLLGWQVNAPYNQPAANDFLPIVTYQTTLRQPKLLDELWRLGDLDQALQAALPANPAPLTVVLDPPPSITLATAEPPASAVVAGEPIALAVPEATVRVTVAAGAGSDITGWESLRDQQRLFQRDLKGEGGQTATEEVKVALVPNRPVRFAVLARNVRGVARTESIDLVYVPPPAPPTSPLPKDKPSPRTPRLEVIALGAERPKGPHLVEIPFADADTSALAPFFSKHLFPVTGQPAEPSSTVERERAAVVLNQGKGTSSDFREGLDQLVGKAKEKQLGDGDALVVVIVAHAVVVDDALMLAMGGPVDKTAPHATMYPANELAETLGGLAADYGCKVVLFLDLIHGDPTETEDAVLAERFKQFVRDLYQNRSVITFIASKEGPSLDDAKGAHGQFALGLLGAFEQVGSAAGVRDRSADYSLLQFKTAVVERVAELTGRRQQAGCYVPRSFSLRERFASPKALSVSSPR